MKNLDKILTKLPAEIGERIRDLPGHIRINLEEIRIRNGSGIVLYAGGKEYALETGNGTKIDNYTINTIFNSLLNFSAYAYQEELANGYITIEGGHRVGICGRTVMENGKVKTIKEISSINIRRSREIIGVSDPIMGYLM
jgi:stage III sporulation protein AA